MRPFLIALAAAAVSSSAAADDFHLRCEGLASKTVGRVTSANAMDSEGHFVSGSATSYGKAEVADFMVLEIVGGMGRVHVPRSMTPPVNSGGADGWWPLTNIEVTETDISAQFRLNPFNHPTVRISRSGGQIAVDGYGNGFHGTCAPQSVETRKF